MMNRGRLEGLEAMRGIAALWVTLYHGRMAVEAFIGSMASVPLLSNGFLGVDFFFILSGFIIAHSSQRLIEQGRDVVDYAKARLVRIYVPYLPIGAVLYFLYLALPSLSAADRSPGLVTSFTLLPTNQPPALSVAWTLVHEMIFYAIFSLTFVSRRLLIGVLTVWGSAICAATLLGIGMPRWAGYIFSPLNLCFLLGVSVFVIGRRWKMPAWMTVASVAIGAACVVGAASSVEPNRILVAIGFTLIVAGISSSFGSQLKIWSWVATVGAASYSIYLVHNPALSVAVRLARRAGAPPSLAMVAICVAAVLCGLLYWRLYEVPALRAMRQRLARFGGTETQKESRPTKGQGA